MKERKLLSLREKNLHRTFAQRSDKTEEPVGYYQLCQTIHFNPALVKCK